MKAGDKVTIRDYSYVRSVVNGELINAPNVFYDHGEEYTVVEIGCTFPLEQRYCPQRMQVHNDTVIQDTSGRVVFIHSRFLKLVDPPKPKHEWVHGDVFELELDCDHGTMIYLERAGDIIGKVRYVDRICTTHSELNYYLDSATFLFNIKDKL